MTALIIVFSVLAALFLLLLIPVKFKIKADGNCLRIYGEYLLIRFAIHPKKAKKSKAEEPQPTPEKTETSKSKNKDYLKNLFKDKGVADALSELFGILKEILSTLGDAAKHISAKKFTLKIRVGGSDAAAAALAFGAANAVVYPALTAIGAIINLKKRDVNILCDFDRKGYSVFADICLSIKPLFVLSAACGVLIKLIKFKAKEGVKNG